MSAPKRLLSILVVASLSTQMPAAAQVFDAAGDFSPSANPNGAWEYGWVAAPGGTFNLYSQSGQPLVAGIDFWYFPALPNPIRPAIQPSVSHNGTAGPVNASLGLIYQPGELVLHPGPNGRLSVLRWTAPADGAFAVEALFRLIDEQARTVDIHVFHGPTEIFGELLTGVGDSATLTTTLTLTAGEVVDVVVGLGQENFFDDSTSLTLTIRPAAVPALPRRWLAALLTLGLLLAGALRLLLKGSSAG